MEAYFPPRPRTGSRIKKEMRAASKKRWWRGERLGSNFKTFDLYGSRVSLTYKGDDAFQTIPGAITSVIIISLLTAFSVNQAIQFFLRENPNVSTQTFVMNLDQ